MKRIYISGPITGYDIEERRRAFAEAEDAVKAKFGCEVVNPLKDQPQGLSWEEYMKRDIKMMLECDTVCLLPGWTDSRGSLLEYTVASNLGYDIKRCHPSPHHRTRVESAREGRRGRKEGKNE